MATRTRTRTQKADPDTAAAATAEPLELLCARASTLVGEAWTDSDGQAWTVEDVEGETIDTLRLRIKSADGVTRYLTVAQVEDCLFAANSKPAERAEAPLDPELLNAGADADEQYRQRQMDPASKPPRPYKLPTNVIEAIERQVTALLPQVFRHNNRGSVTVNIGAKRGSSDGEADIRYEFKMTPPKERVDGCYWAGEDLGDTGLPKRQPESQTTIFDAKASIKAPATPEPVDDQADVLEPVEPRHPDDPPSDADLDAEAREVIG